MIFFFILSVKWLFSNSFQGYKTAHACFYSRAPVYESVHVIYGEMFLLDQQKGNIPENAFL